MRIWSRQSYLGLWGELCLKLRENPQSQQADLREETSDIGDKNVNVHIILQIFCIILLP